MKEALALTLALFACTERPGQRPSVDRTVPAPITDSVPASSTANDLVRPGVLPTTVRATCDSALTLVREALALDVKRKTGTSPIPSRAPAVWAVA